MGFVDTAARTRRTIITELDLLPAENYRKTRAQGVAEFNVGGAFCSDETGEMRRYERIAAAPGYFDLGDEAAPANRAMLDANRDAASAATSALTGLTDYALARRARVDLLANSYGAAGTGLTDVSAELNALLADNLGPNVITPRVNGYVDNTSGGSWACSGVASPIRVPHRKHFIGMGDQTNFRPMSTLTGAMFYLNTDGEKPINSTPFGLSTRFENIWVVNRDENGNPTSGIPVMKFAGQQRIEEITSFGFATIIEQISGGVSYSDTLWIKRIRSSDQPDTGDDNTRRPLVRLVSNGDALDVSQISNDLPVDATGAKRKMRGYSFFALGRNSGSVPRIINGDVRIASCNDFLLDKLYMEQGRTTILSSSVNLDGAIYYMRGDQTNGVDDPVVVTPLQFLKSTDVNFVCNLSRAANIQFRYLAGWKYPWGYQGNFECDYAQSIDFENNYRLYGSTDAQVSTILGVMQQQNARQAQNGDTAYKVFNNYSHIASLKARWEWADDKGRWRFSASFGALTWPVGFSGVTTTITLAGSGKEVRWNKPTGTYYYRAVAYYDRVRALGVIGAIEKSFSLTNGAKPIPALFIDQLQRGHPLMVRVYRGTAANSYDSYVEVPVLSGGPLVDSGLDLSGFQWTARAASAVDPVNDVGAMQGFRLTPGAVTPTSDAYGHAEVETDVNVMPAYGSWRKGDRVLLRVPVGENGHVKQGWERITDCTSAAPTNAIYTDWMPIMVGSPHGSRTTPQLQQLVGVVNNMWKSAGLRVFNSTTMKWVTAQGSAPASVWVEDGTGAVYTPA